MASVTGKSEAAITKPTALSGLRGAWWKWGTGLLMSYVIYGAFFIAQGAAGFGQGGDKARIVFFHVPSAVLAYVCYAVATFYAILTLRNRNTFENDAKSSVAMELGFLYCILATITGSIFAGVQWGQFWNWDPRETSILVMLLLYAAYGVLRGATAEEPEKQARFAALYAILMLVPATFLIWIVPRITAGLHPTTTLTTPRNTSPSYKMVLYPSFLAFTMLYVWLFQLRLRLVKLTARRRTKQP